MKTVGLKTNLHSIMYLLIREQCRKYQDHMDLHSIMYLLIPRQESIPKKSLKQFTFHNVSINSHRQSVKFLHQFVFTFHNVSINSICSGSFIQDKYTFTFHNVSINSLFYYRLMFRPILIYIP